MNDKDKTSSALDIIRLVSCAVNNETPDKRICERTDMSGLLKTASNHSLRAAAAFALEKVTVLPEDFREAKYKAVRRSALFNFERNAVLNALENNKIRYMTLKGIVLRECYPKTSMREMSDNDILCDENRMSDVRSVMESLGFVCKSYEKSHHDIYSKPPQLYFEMHRSLFDRDNEPEFYAYFMNIWDKAVRNDNNGYGYHLTNDDMYIYLICHLYLHYRTKGTGLRSLLDIYVFNKKYRDCLDRGYIEAELKKLELNRFERKIRELSEKTFTAQPLSEDELDELSFFILSTTHGTMDNYLANHLNNDDSVGTKTKYALSRLFPSRENLRTTHPFVYNHMGIYPLWILYRSVKGAVKYPKKMSGEIKRLIRFRKKDNMGEFNK